TIQLLDKAPVIDSVVIRENYPVVYYTVFAQLGLTQNIAIVMADSVLLEIAVPHSFNDVKQYTRQLTGAPVDSLRVWGNRAGRAGKPFGIRLIVEIPQQGEKAYGVAAASLHLPPL
ncbi:MAG: hypothetical protein JNL74_02785, partial [Fibrobacteres bacterium]|nr:hypothetical protein [Fibrobacterota bacterium]